MIPELQSPIPSAKAAPAFLSVWSPQQHGGKKVWGGGNHWRNVTIPRAFSWRGRNGIERSYSWTPSSIETLDQNGRLQGSAAFFLYSSWSPANWSYLAGRSNFCLLPIRQRFALACASSRFFLSVAVKFGTCRRGASLVVEAPRRGRGGHSSCGCREGVKFLDIGALGLQERVVTAADVDRKSHSEPFICQQVQVKCVRSRHPSETQVGGGGGSSGPSQVPKWKKKKFHSLLDRSKVVLNLWGHFGIPH